MHDLPKFVYPEIPPRFFFRRVVALIVDLVFVTLVLAALAAPVVLALGGDPVKLLSRQTLCREIASGPLVEIVESNWPLGPDEERKNVACMTEGVFKPSYFFHSTVTTKTAQTTVNRYVTMAVDQTFQPLKSTLLSGSMAVALDMVVPFAGFMFLAAMTAHGRRTPGKRLVGLRVCRWTGENLSFRRALTREALKNLPYLVWTCIGVSMAVVGLMSPGYDGLIAMINIVKQPDGAGSADWLMTGTVACAFFALIWHFGPFFFWHGQAFWDRLTDSKVVLNRKAARESTAEETTVTSA